MTTPSGNRFAYSKQYLVLGHEARPRATDANPDELGVSFDSPTLFGPVPRFGSTLMMMWQGVDRILDGGDSYQQAIGGQSAGPVAGYSWSGGGTSATRTYNFGSTGLQEIVLTVTDDNGVSSSGHRWVRVVDPANIVASGVTNAFTWSRFASDLGGGLGGSQITVELHNAANSNLYVIGRMVAIYVEEYEGATAATQTLTAAGEVFVGYITSVELELRPDGDRLRFTAGTIEQIIALENVVDGANHLFLDAALQDAAGEAGDPIQGPVDSPAGIVTVYPAHVMTNLTVGKAIYHLLRYHLLFDVSIYVYSLVEICDVIRDWWNDGDETEGRVDYFNIPRGNLARAIASMLPQGLWIVYGKRNGGLVVTKIHAAKPSPDPVLDSISMSYCYAGVKPTKGMDNVVRQVVLIQSVEATTANDTDMLVARYPATPNAQGSLYQPNQMFWVTTQAALDDLAEALYNDLRSTDRFQVALRGHTFDLHNIAQVTLSALALTWINKKFQVERVEFERDHEWMGPINQTLSLREIP